MNSAIISDINEIDEALSQNYPYEKLVDLHRKIDCKYSNKIPDIGMSMYGYNKDYGFNYESIGEKAVKENLTSLKYKLEGLIPENEDYRNKKNRILFISHARADKEYMNALISLLEGIGMSEDSVICTSVPGFGIPNGAKIYDWLREQLSSSDLRVLFVLSKAYYDNASCLNEMGAAWVTKSTYTLLLLPGFTYDQIEGCIDKTCVGISCDSDEAELKDRLTEFKDTLVKEYELTAISASKWERYRDNFIQKVREIAIEAQKNGNLAERKIPSEEKTSQAPTSGKNILRNTTLKSYLEGKKKDDKHDIEFGHYLQDSDGRERPIKWLKLDKDSEGKTLLVSKNALACEKYNKTLTENVTWDNCTLRVWLNTEFYDSAFTEDEKKRIAKKMVTADPNPKTEADPGESIPDKVFLLSIPEVIRYFGDDKDRVCELTDYMKEYVINAYHPVNKKICCWWLRTPGGDNSRTVNVRENGEIYYKGHHVDSIDFCVRPAIWVQL